MRIPLAVDIESRSASTAKDARIVNGYVDTEGQIKRVVKRPGLQDLAVSPALGVHSAQGLVAFKATGKLYAANNNKLYSITTAGVSTNLSSSVALTNGVYSFASTDEFAYLFMQNGTDAYYLDSGTETLTKVTSTDFPTNQTPAFTLAPGVVYLDDYIFVMTTTGRIYNSGIEDVSNSTGWNAINYISKSSEPDGGVGIAKHLSYLVAWGQWSGEFFYDAANATGSPLARNDTLKMEIGCANGQSIVQFKTVQTVCWVGTSRETGRGVYHFQGLAPKKISNRAIDAFLNADAMTNVRAMAVTIAGHPLYILTLKDSGYTFVYDLHENVWLEWTSYNGTAEVTFAPEFFASIGGDSYMLDGANGLVYTLKTTVYQDNGADIYFRVVTPRFDGGHNKNKFLFSLEVIGDQATVANSVSIRNSKDDYNTWSNYRTVDMTKKKPIIYQLGDFRRISLDILHIANEGARFEAIEADATGGSV